MQLLLKGLLRGSIPLVMMSLIALVLYIQERNIEARGTFISAWIAFWVSAATIIYQTDSWSLTKQTLIHCFVMLLTVFPILVFSGWFPVDTWSDIARVFLFFLLVGFILWILAAIFRKIFHF